MLQQQQTQQQMPAEHNYTHVITTKMKMKCRKGLAAIACCSCQQQQQQNNIKSSSKVVFNNAPFAYNTPSNVATTKFTQSLPVDLNFNQITIAAAATAIAIISTFRTYCCNRNERHVGKLSTNRSTDAHASTATIITTDTAMATKWPAAAHHCQHRAIATTTTAAATCDSYHQQQHDKYANSRGASTMNWSASAATLLKPATLLLLLLVATEERLLHGSGFAVAADSVDFATPLGNMTAALHLQQTQHIVGNSSTLMQGLTLALGIYNNKNSISNDDGPAMSNRTATAATKQPALALAASSIAAALAAANFQQTQQHLPDSSSSRGNIINYINRDSVLKRYHNNNNSSNNSATQASNAASSSSSSYGANTCPSCQQLREKAKLDNLESIKQHILRRLQLTQLPNITAPIPVPHNILENFYKHYNASTQPDAAAVAASRAQRQQHERMHSSTSSGKRNGSTLKKPLKLAAGKNVHRDVARAAHVATATEVDMVEAEVVDDYMDDAADMLLIQSDDAQVHQRQQQMALPDAHLAVDVLSVNVASASASMKHYKYNAATVQLSDADVDVDGELDDEVNLEAADDNIYYGDSDDDMDMYGHDVEDAYFSRINSIYVFPTMPRIRHNRRPEILNFKYDNSHSSISRAIMHVYIRGRDWMREYDPTLLEHRNTETGRIERRRELVITVHRAVRRPKALNFTHTVKLLESRHKIPPGLGQWVQIELEPLAKYWMDNRNVTQGIVVKGLEPWMRPFIVTGDNGQNKPLTVHIEVMTEDKRRRKRSTSLDCQESDHEVRCCRYPLKVNFTNFGWHFVVAPTSFDAYFCNGECKVGYLEQYTHTHIASLTTSATPCCSPTKMSSLSLLYFNLDQNLVYSTIPNMSVEKCSCS